MTEKPELPEVFLIAMEINIESGGLKQSIRKAPGDAEDLWKESKEMGDFDIPEKPTKGIFKVAANLDLKDKEIFIYYIAYQVGWNEVDVIRETRLEKDVDLLYADTTRMVMERLKKMADFMPGGQQSPDSPFEEVVSSESSGKS